MKYTFQLKPGFSLYLDLLRFFAALLVYVSHAGYFAKFRLPIIGDSGSQGVIIFFVLSGFVVAFTALRKHGDVTGYMVARLARLWSLVIPAIALTIILDVCGQQIFASAYAPMQPYSISKWIASASINALFLNQIWFLNIWLGTNGPFWSMSYEFWYYVIFASLIYFKGKKRLLLGAIAALIAGPGILIALPVWLMGVALYKSIKMGYEFPNPMLSLLLFMITALIFVYYVGFDGRVFFEYIPFDFRFANLKNWGVNFWPESYLLGILVTLHLYAASRINSLYYPSKWIVSAVRNGAKISFGLYLFHYPLMYFVKALLFKMGVSHSVLFSCIIYVVPFFVASYLAVKCEVLKEIFSKSMNGLVVRLKNKRTLMNKA